MLCFKNRVSKLGRRSICIEQKITFHCLPASQSTLYRPGGLRCPLSPKFQFYFKKGSSKKIPMSVAPMSWKTKRAYLRLCPEKRRRKRIWSMKG